MAITARQSVQEPDIPMKKRRSWWLQDENYNALAAEIKRRGGTLSDNAMLNEIVREWREYKAAERLNHFDTTLQPPTSVKP